MPDPDLIIRTSGEERISNFLLWQAAYSELYFTPVYWPDFDREHLYEADPRLPEAVRRFGAIAENDWRRRSPTGLARRLRRHASGRSQRPGERRGPMADLMEAVTSLAKRRGIAFQSSEIYGGLRSSWDYGPLGVELQRNIRSAWWRSMVQLRDDVVGL